MKHLLQCEYPLTHFRKLCTRSVNSIYPYTHRPLIGYFALQLRIYGIILLYLPRIIGFVHIARKNGIANVLLGQYKIFRLTRAELSECWAATKLWNNNNNNYHYFYSLCIWMKPQYSINFEVFRVCLTPTKIGCLVNAILGYKALNNLVMGLRPDNLFKIKATTGRRGHQFKLKELSISCSPSVREILTHGINHPFVGFF